MSILSQYQSQSVHLSIPPDTWKAYTVPVCFAHQDSTPLSYSNGISEMASQI